MTNQNKLKELYKERMFNVEQNMAIAGKSNTARSGNPLSELEMQKLTTAQVGSPEYAWPVIKAEVNTGAARNGYLPLEHYGYDHAKKTSELAVYIGQTLSLSDQELKIIHAAAFFHDIGRSEPWQRLDSGHNERSVTITAKLLLNDPAKWPHKQERDDVCRLISLHTLASIDPPTDPRLQALWDADCFEGARFAPRTPEGVKILAARMGQVCTPWGHNIDNQRKWRETRGW